jgi:phosphoglycolate phosphatase-like HAD superfamily hydrolase
VKAIKMSSLSHIIFFDVDGTLVKSDANSNIVHKDSFRHSFQQVFNIDTSISAINHQGKTDLLIFQELAALNNIVLAQEDIEKLISSAVEYCFNKKDSIKVHLLPGVVDFLEYLKSQDNILVGLITGNIEEICYLKLDRVYEGDSTEQFSIKHFFSPSFGLSGKSLGAFGGTTTLRGELIVNALRSLKIQDPSNIRVFHVGDTPFDVEAAQYATKMLTSEGYRVHGVGVATGNFSTHELERSICESKTILNDMSKLDESIRVFEL